MEAIVTYVFLFPNSPLVGPEQAADMVKPHIVHELQGFDRDVARLGSFSFFDAEQVVTTFYNDAVNAIRMRFRVTVDAVTPEWGRRLILSAVTVHQTPQIAPFYCIEKSLASTTTADFLGEFVLGTSTLGERVSYG